MNHLQVKLAAGLYLVATPIGNARDITLRALDVLASADVVAAEDTRTAKKIMQIHGLPVAGRRFVAFHDHSGERDLARLLDEIDAGAAVAYASEAGTPLVSDPGFELVRAANQRGQYVTALPGASAVLAALCVAGLPTDLFCFAGFLPPKTQARRQKLAELGSFGGTLCFYESPKRVAAMLADASDVLGEKRFAVMCRELTKKFEETARGPLSELAARYAQNTPRGECVVMIAPSMGEKTSQHDIQAALVKAMETMRVKDAANSVAGRFGVPSRQVYQMALDLKSDDN